MTVKDWLYLGTWIVLFIGTWAHLFDQERAVFFFNLGAGLFFTRDAIERFARLRATRKQVAA